MDSDSKLLSKAYAKSIADRIAKRREGYPTCPKCHKGKMHFNMQDIKCCDNCGYTPSMQNLQDPMSENSDLRN